MNRYKVMLKDLSRIAKICKEVDEGKSESYNIFKVIRMTSNETSVHSAFISDLLNPKGYHKMGVTFLTLFYETLTEEMQQEINDFSFNDAIVSVEEYIGDKSELEGGRLDIIIKSKDQAIVIENKINADDQTNQMIRYKNYAKTNYKKHLLLYLSLDGEIHDQDKTLKTKDQCLFIGEDLYTISYRETIYEWLKQCHEKAVDKPLLREAISHYMNLIVSLTQRNKLMESEINEMTGYIIDHPEYIENVEKYIKAFDKVKLELQKKFWSVLLKKLLEEQFNVTFYKRGDALVGLNTSDASKNECTEKLEKQAILKEKLEGEVDKYYKTHATRWSQSKHHEYGLSIPIAENNNKQLIFSLVLNQNILCYISVVDNNGKSINHNSKDEIPECWRILENWDLPKGWQNNQSFRLTGFYPSDLRLNFYEPNSVQYKWCADMDNKVSDLIEYVKNKIKEIQEDVLNQNKN